MNSIDKCQYTEWYNGWLVIILVVVGFIAMLSASGSNHSTLFSRQIQEYDLPQWIFWPLPRYINADADMVRFDPSVEASLQAFIITSKIEDEVGNARFFVRRTQPGVLLITWQYAQPVRDVIGESKRVKRHIANIEQHAHVTYRHDNVASPTIMAWNATEEGGFAYLVFPVAACAANRTTNPDPSWFMDSSQNNISAVWPTMNEWLPDNWQPDDVIFDFHRCGSKLGDMKEISQNAPYILDIGPHNVDDIFLAKIVVSRGEAFRFIYLTAHNK